MEIWLIATVFNGNCQIVCNLTQEQGDGNLAYILKGNTRIVCNLTQEQGEIVICNVCCCQWQLNFRTTNYSEQDAIYLHVQTYTLTGSIYSCVKNFASSVLKSRLPDSGPYCSRVYASGCSCLHRVNYTRKNARWYQGLHVSAH